VNGPVGEPWESQGEQGDQCGGGTTDGDHGDRPLPAPGSDGLGLRRSGRGRPGGTKSEQR
jgi:hypothetical protein